MKLFFFLLFLPCLFALDTLFMLPLNPENGETFTFISEPESCKNLVCSLPVFEPRQEFLGIAPTWKMSVEKIQELRKVYCKGTAKIEFKIPLGIQGSLSMRSECLD